MPQSNPLVLIFAIIAFVKLRQSPESTMLDVFLPVLLLVPAIYYLHLPHIPLISCYDAVLCPLGVAAVICRPYNWRFQRADLWVLLFALAAFYTDYINLDLNTAFYNFLSPGHLGAVFAYCIGKLLIEQAGLREQFAKRLTTLLACVGFISISEFVGRLNLFVIATHRFFGQASYWGVQYRGGFRRVMGPFMGAEEAGIVFLMGFFLSLWLWFLNRSRHGQQEPKYLGLHRSSLYSGGILLGLIMTLSRGPGLGAATGYLIARVGMVKKKHLALVVALVLIFSGVVIAHRRAVALEAIADRASLDESSASATYRTRLYDVYEPVAEAGGMFGWSPTAYTKAAFAINPKSANFFSIDNEYLLLWVTQGKVGLILFILMFIEGAIALTRAILHSQQSVDASLYYCLGGILAGLAVVLTTVFLAGQGYVLFFLLSGWIQSLPVDSWVPRTGPQFSFRRIIK